MPVATGIPTVPSTWSQDDEDFWWTELHHPLLSLLQSAGYSEEDQERHTAFVRRFVVPSLGPQPQLSAEGNRLPHFDSFCCDDFSPIELSWNLTPASSTVRIGSEPVGRNAGKIKDPFNQAEPGVVMADVLRQASEIGDDSVDGELWDYFRKHLHVESRHAQTIVDRMAPNEHMTTNTISFDLSPGKSKSFLPAPKVYFYPIPVSLLRKEPAGEIITEALEKLPGVNLGPAFDKVRDFVYQYKHLRGNEMILRLELIAFDAVKPTQSRFKIYVRTKETSLDAVEFIYTLGGTLKGPEIDEAVKLIRNTYLQVLGTSARHQELPVSTHRTAGIIFNFEVMHDNPNPAPKVYIPARHYGGTDLRIAQGLGNLFRATAGLEQYAEMYPLAAQKAFPTQDFSTTIGRHSYIGLSYNKRGPYVTMYYNSMTFSPGTERDGDGKLVGPAAWRQRHLLN